METTRPLRFGVNLLGVDPADVPGEARAAEEMGFDILHVADHLGTYAPFAALAAAAVATTRIRLGTLVLNNEFWNPAILARAAATVDRISGGRFELGLGCGHMKSEFDAAGIPWRPHAERVERLERSVAELGRLFAEDGQQPKPVQARLPLLIGAHGERTLAVAARRADIVGYGGLVQIPGATMGTFRVARPAETLQRVEFVAERAGARAADIESNALIQAVVLTDDAEKEAAELAERFAGAGFTSARDILDNPFVLVGTAGEVAAEIVANRDRYGFSYVVTHGPSRAALAQVIPLARQLAGEETGG